MRLTRVRDGIGNRGLLMGACLMLLAGCSNESPDTTPAQEQLQNPGSEASNSGQILDPVSTLAADVRFCAVPDPKVPSSAFVIEQGEPDGDAGWWVHYQCKEVCDDWRQCKVPAVELDNEATIYNARQPDMPKSALAFVIDGMGGHVAWTEDGDNTLILHEGGGAPVYYTIPAAKLEQRTSLKTVMVRWEGGYGQSEAFNWGWFTRSAEGPSTVPGLNRRVAGIFAWIHENLSANQRFGTMGCSIGTTATLGPVVWHGLDDIIDYQLLSGGTPMGDVNALCGRREYTSGFCDRDGVTTCTSNADCSGQDNLCSFAQPITETWAFEEVINHVHATNPGACRVADVTGDTRPYPPFDQSSFAISAKDIEIDHRVDLVVNLRGELDWSDPENIQIGGDEHWGLGSYLLAYNHIQPRERSYLALDGHHCGNDFTEEAINLVISGMHSK